MTLPILAATCVACVLLGGIATVAVAQGPSITEPQLDTTWMTTPRDLDLVQGPSGFHWTSSLDEKDVIRGFYDMKKGTYRMTFTPTDTETPTSLALDVNLEALIEFHDQDEDGAYDVGERTYQRVRLAEIEDVTQEVVPYYDGGHRITVRYPLGPEPEQGLPFGDEPDEPQGLLVFTFYVLPDVRSIDGVIVHPTQTKVDIEIKDFPWQANGTMVALQTRAASEGGLETEDSGVATENGLFSIAYAWDGTAAADGVEGTPAVTQLQNHDGSHDVLLAYPHAGSIVHDPAIGAQRHVEPTIIEGIQTAITEGDPVVYGVGLVATTLLIGGVTYHRLRRSA